MIHDPFPTKELDLIEVRDEDNEPRESWLYCATEFATGFGIAAIVWLVVAAGTLAWVMLP